jgi:molybdate transport system regulatory protein
MRVAYRVWIEHNGKAFGEGPYRLLRLIEREGSISKAASSMGLSYRKAWTILRNVEKRLGLTLLKRRIGGQSGGGSSLTPEALQLVELYERFRGDLDRSIREVFERYFSSMFSLD